jgi:hypothetical protein
MPILHLPSFSGGPGITDDAEVEGDEEGGLDAVFAEGEVGNIVVVGCVLEDGGEVGDFVD